MKKIFFILAIAVCLVSASYGASVASDKRINWVKHKVKKGDTLFSLAQKAELREDSLIRYNNLSGSDIKIGQIIYVPVRNAVEKQRIDKKVKIKKPKKLIFLKHWKEAVAEAIQSKSQRAVQIRNYVVCNGRQYQIPKLPSMKERLAIISKTSKKYGIDKEIVFAILMNETRIGEYYTIVGDQGRSIGPGQIQFLLHRDKISFEDALSFAPTVDFICRLLIEKGWRKNKHWSVRRYNGNPNDHAAWRYLQEVKENVQLAKIEFKKYKIS